ncbi:ankyrin-1-like [Trichogramma pretiosum]|uniref:ankyrin-1-like n=1 Tax=Trichogramma pretiosum TaxID=7493 RepID=UPI0006C9C2C7|nr:ankyrin-1-like [Trichogramma pretiosum]
MEHEGHHNQNNVESLWTLHENVNWEIQEERVQFLIDIGPFISDCASSELPDLLSIFTKGEIDCLLTDTVQFWTELGYGNRDHFLDFLIRARYRDDPERDEYGYIVVSYTTPVHHAAKLYMFDRTTVLYRLFKIYNLVDVNFVDETGLSHFHIACMSGHVDAVENFLMCEQDPNCTWTDTGETPLHLAAKYEHKEVIVLLMKAGADSNAMDFSRRTPLHSVCKAKGYAAHEVVEVLFNNIYYDYQPFDVDARDSIGRTPLNWALQNKPQEKLVKLLMRYCFDQNIADYYGETPVHIICKRSDGHIFLEKFFGFSRELKRTVEVNGRDLDGNTPLHLALKKKHNKMMRMLLLNGADPNIANNKGWSVIQIIFQKQCIDYHWVHMILTCTRDQYRAGVLDRQTKEGNTLLHWAVRNKKTKRIDYLMEKRSNPNVTDSKGFTVMHMLCQDDFTLAYQSKMIAMLLEYGADPNVPSPRGHTALHVICKKAGDKADLAEMFLNLCIENKWRRIEIDALDGKGFTPLYWALKKNNLEVAKLLLNKGASPYLADAKGLTPLHYICQRDDDDDLVEEFFRICEERGEQVQVDIPNKQGNTALHLALTGRCKRHVVDVLLRRGADPTLVNLTGWNALHFACKRKSDADILAELLFEFCDESDRPLEVDPRDNSNNTPLLLAAKCACDGVEELFRLLLERGADPNARNDEYKTPLHIVSERDDIGNYFTVFAQAAPAAPGEPVTIYATTDDNIKALVDHLLRKGAKPNAGDAEGSTALHHIARRKRDEGLASRFFEINDELGQRVEVDCQDIHGDTPLHLVLRCFRGEANALPELLLRRGADPNKPNAEGLTPLHIMCHRTSYWQGIGELIFQVVAERNLRVEVEARDSENRTPLMSAVARVDLGMVEFLLSRGASVAENDFVFPNYEDFDYVFRNIGYENMILKVKLAAGILKAVEMLEDRGFTLGPKSTMAIFKLFANRKLYETSEEWSYKNSLPDDELEPQGPGRCEIVPGLTLDQLIRLPIREASTRLELVDYYKFADKYDREYEYSTYGTMTEDCVLHLCEILSREIFERWATQAVYDMTGMPINCCDMIASDPKLMNKDLWRICLTNMNITDKQIEEDSLLRVFMPARHGYF